MDDDIGGGYTNDDGGDEYKSNERGDVNDGGNNGAADGNNADGDVMRRMVVIRMYTIMMLMLNINLVPSASFRYKKEGKKSYFQKIPLGTRLAGDGENKVDLHDAYSRGGDSNEDDRIHDISSVDTNGSDDANCGDGNSKFGRGDDIDGGYGYDKMMMMLTLIFVMMLTWVMGRANLVKVKIQLLMILTVIQLVVPIMIVMVTLMTVFGKVVIVMAKVMMVVMEMKMITVMTMLDV